MLRSRYGAGASTADLVGARRQIAFPRGGADVHAIDNHAKLLASARLNGDMPFGSLSSQGRVDHRFAVWRDLRASSERHESGLGYPNLVRPAGDADERGYRRGSEDLPIEV